MKLSSTVTTLVISLVLVLALITSIVNIDPYSSSIILLIQNQPKHEDHHHNMDHEHKPLRIVQDSHQFGLSPADKYIAYSGYGRLSNNLVMLGYAIKLSQLTGRKVLVYPPSTVLGDNHFSLSWLQLLNINAISSQLNPAQRPCLIRGFNYGEPDPDVLEYIYNGTLVNARNQCDESINDAPWQLRDPNSWSTDCYLLPWSLTPYIASITNDSIPLVTTKVNHAEFNFPGNGSCGKFPLEHHHHIVEAGFDPVPTVTSLNDKLILMTGDAMFHCNALSAPDLPPSLHIESIASTVISDRLKPVLCMHIRRTDLSLIPLSTYIQSANDLINSSSAHHVIIITDAANVELEQLRSGININIEIGCDHERIAPCKNSENMRAAIEQQICARSDLFLGSPQSTFTNRVLNLRRHMHMSENSSLILK